MKIIQQDDDYSKASETDDIDDETEENTHFVENDESSNEADDGTESTVKKGTGNEMKHQKVIIDCNFYIILRKLNDIHG